MDSSKVDPPTTRPGKRAKRESTIHIRVTAEALAYIDQLAEKEERTRSDMVRVLLRRGMERP